ncbi:MAG: hypothetical protein QXW39_07375 [Candidatus Bathyarchaeia archaeon]
MPTVYPLYVSKDKKEIFQRFVEIARREGKKVSALLLELAEDYVKKHGSGNPTFPLDKWVENNEVLAFPTLGEPAQIMYLIKLDKEMLQKIKEHAQSYADKATLLLKELEKHEGHRKYGIKDEYCTYCKFGL